MLVAPSRRTQDTRRIAKQANIAAGPQQVNNGVPAFSPHARENPSTPNELLESMHGEWMDTGKACATIGSNQALVPVEPVNRTENTRG